MWPTRALSADCEEIVSVCSIILSRTFISAGREEKSARKCDGSSGAGSMMDRIGRESCIFLSPPPFRELVSELDRRAPSVSVSAGDALD